MPRNRSGRSGTTLRRTAGRVVPSALLLLLGCLVLTGVLGSGGHTAAAAPAVSLPPSAAGTTVAGTPMAAMPTVVRPMATVTLSVAGLSPSAIALEWTPTNAIGFVSYTIYLSSNGSSGPWQSVGVVTSQSTGAFALQGLAPETTYWWEVAESDLFGTSYSNVANATQSSLAFLNYTFATATDAVFNWTNNASYGGLLQFSSYVLYEIVGTAPATPVATIASLGTRSASVPGLSPGTSYGFYLNTSECLGGCGGASPTLAITGSNLVTLGTPLPLVASVAANRPAVDVGQPDYFACTPSGGSSPFTFEWDFGSGSFAAGASGVSSAFPTPGPVTVTCRVTDAIASQSTAATTVTVSEDPVVTVAANRSAADAGQSIALTCTVSLGVTPYSISWSFGDGGSAGGAAAAHAYTTAGTYAATCSASDSTGTSAVASLALLVSPALHVAATSSSSAAAPGTTVAFNGSASNGSGDYPSFTWNFGDGTSAAGPNASHAFGTSGNFTVLFRGSDSNGGTAIATVIVRVSAIVLALGTVAPSAETGAPIHFSVSASGGAGAPYNVSWVWGDGGAGYGASSDHSFSTAGTYRPIAVVTDRLGAATNATVSAITVSAPPPPEPWVNGGVILAIAVAIGLVAGLVALLWQRRAGERVYPSHAGRVPATDPATTVQGTKVCRVCGTANRSIRETCEACGASLRESWLR